MHAVSLWSSGVWGCVPWVGDAAGGVSGADLVHGVFRDDLDAAQGDPEVHEHDGDGPQGDDGQHSHQRVDPYRRAGDLQLKPETSVSLVINFVIMCVRLILAMFVVYREWVNLATVSIWHFFF